MNEKTNFLNELFLSMDEVDRLSIQKIQSIYGALISEYDIEVAKPNNNNGKLLSLLSQSSAFDTIILQSIVNQNNVAIENSPLRFYLNSLSMINTYLVNSINNYEENKHILSGIYGLNTREEALGYLEVINYINNIIQELKIFNDNELEIKNLDELTSQSNEIDSSKTEHKIQVVELEDGITIKV